MSTENRKNMVVVAVAFSIGVCAYFIWKVDWIDKEKSQWTKPLTEKQREACGSSSFDDQKIAGSAQLDKLITKKSANLGFQNEVISRVSDDGEDHSDVEPVLKESTIPRKHTKDEADDSSNSSMSEEQDSNPRLFRPDSLHPIVEDILALPPMARYKSCVAELFEVSESQEIGHYIGVNPVDLCWHRGDEGNATDYYETMCITWNHLAEINSTPTSFEVPHITSDEFRNLKRKLAIAFIDAMPKSRRNISLLSVAVDKIWNEVTEFKQGEVRVNMVLFNQELAWLVSKRKKKKISLREYNNLLTTVKETPTTRLSYVSMNFGQGRSSRLDLIQKPSTNL